MPTVTQEQCGELRALLERSVDSLTDLERLPIHGLIPAIESAFRNDTMSIRNIIGYISNVLDTIEAGGA